MKTQKNEKTAFIKLKTSKLTISEMPETNLDLLSDDMNEKLAEILPENDLKIYYSLSYCQGDGVSFQGRLSKKNIEQLIKRDIDEKLIEAYEEEAGEFGAEVVKTSHQYEHEYTMRAEFEPLDKEIEGLEELEKELTEAIRETARELEKYGYSSIDHYSRDHSFIYSFLHFKEINKIEDDRDYFNFDYSEEPREGFIKAWDGGDSYFPDLFIKLPTLEEKSRKIAYTEKFIIFND